MARWNRCLPAGPEGHVICTLATMTNGPDLPMPPAPAQALGWLERLYELTPDTVVLYVEVSGSLVLLALAILLLRPPWRR